LLGTSYGKRFFSFNSQPILILFVLFGRAYHWAYSFYTDFWNFNY